MDDCLFCKIAAKEIPARIVHEDGKTLAFLDINQRSPGHTMVISRTHARGLLDLPDEEIYDLFAAVKRVLEKIEKAYKPDGFSIGINHGAVSGQEVEHLHIHVMPRFEGDGGHPVQSLVNNPPKESLDAIALKIKNENEK